MWRKELIFAHTVQTLLRFLFHQPKLPGHVRLMYPERVWEAIHHPENALYALYATVTLQQGLTLTEVTDQTYLCSVS